MVDFVNLSRLILYGFAAGTVILFSGLAFVSFLEHEYRASKRALLLAITTPWAFVAGTILSSELQLIFTAFILLTLSIVLWFWFLKPLKATEIVPLNPVSQIDERDIMFSRRLLQPGDERYEAYYNLRPQFKENDDVFRKNPGLLGTGSIFYNARYFAAAEASFQTISGLHHLVDARPGIQPAPELTAQDYTSFIRVWMLHLGAHTVGFTKLMPHHLYSHVGRGPDFGKEVTLDHPFAIALTVKMGKEPLDYAPAAPTVMESANQYVKSGVLAIQLAQFIGYLGFNARAHVDGNYRVVCPLVARDAGLGTIGRMGLLMTPALGPRVRIAVVTTDMPLELNPVTEDASVLDFCRICKKCADVCPAQAIPDGPMRLIDGIERWQIDQEKCFHYWTLSGTDCGRCMRVCPYSHPNTLLHNLVRRGLKRSAAFRQLALKMDDFLYGRKPAPKPMP